MEGILKVLSVVVITILIFSVINMYAGSIAPALAMFYQKIGLIDSSLNIKGDILDNTLHNAYVMKANELASDVLLVVLICYAIYYYSQKKKVSKR